MYSVPHKKTQLKAILLSNQKINSPDICRCAGADRQYLACIILSVVFCSSGGYPVIRPAGYPVQHFNPQPNICRCAGADWQYLACIILSVVFCSSGGYSVIRPAGYPVQPSHPLIFYRCAGADRQYFTCIILSVVFCFSCWLSGYPASRISGTTLSSTNVL